MNRSRSARLPVLLAGFGGVAGFLLRLFALLNGTDSSRLLVTGSPWLVLLILFAAAITAALLVLILRGPHVKKGNYRSFARGTGDLLCGLLGALLVFAGSIAELLRDASGTGLYLGVGGLLCALLLALAALQRRLRRPVSFWEVFPVTVWAAVRLILHFKSWSFDPRVIDFCCRLFADVTALLALQFLSGFCLKVGRTRAAVLWCLLAYVFSVASVPDFLLGWGSTLGECLIGLGLGLYCLTCAVQLLNGRTRVPRPAPAEESPAEEPPAEATGEWSGELPPMPTQELPPEQPTEPQTSDEELPRRFAPPPAPEPTEFPDITD